MWIFTRIKYGSCGARGVLSLWRMVALAILSLEHPQNDKWSKMLGETHILLEKLIQEGCWNVKHVVVEFCYSAFCFGITSHPLMKHVSSLSLYYSEIKRCLAFYFDKIFWCKIKAGQS